MLCLLRGLTLLSLLSFSIFDNLPAALCINITVLTLFWSVLASHVFFHLVDFNVYDFVFQTSFFHTSYSWVLLFYSLWQFIFNLMYVDHWGSKWLLILLDSYLSYVLLLSICCPCFLFQLLSCPLFLIFVGYIENFMMLLSFWETLFSYCL